MDTRREGAAGFAAALTDPARLPDGIDPRHARRVDIHRNNAAHTMAEALAATFPAVRKLVGDAFFAATAREYLAVDPPRSALLFRHGAGFGDFVEGFAPAASVPYLADIARVEWLRLRAFHAADAAPAGIEALGAVAPEALPATLLEPHPALGVVRSRFPVVAIWADVTGADDGRRVDMGVAETAAVTRPDMAVETRALDAATGAFLAAVATRRPLGEAAAAAAAEDPDTGLATHLGAVFRIGAVAAITPPPQAEGEPGP